MREGFSTRAVFYFWLRKHTAIANKRLTTRNPRPISLLLLNGCSSSACPETEKTTPTNLTLSYTCQQFILRQGIGQCLHLDPSKPQFRWDIVTPGRQNELTANFSCTNLRNFETQLIRQSLSPSQVKGCSSWKIPPMLKLNNNFPLGFPRTLSR